MLISLEQLVVSAERAAGRAAEKAMIAKVRGDAAAESFNLGQVAALETMVGSYRLAFEQGKLADLGASFFVNGAAVALAVERITTWLADMAGVGLILEDAEHQRIERANFAQSWLARGP